MNFENPAFTALLGSAVTALFAVIGYWLKIRSEHKIHLQEIALQCAKIAHDSQIELVRIAPDKRHVLKPMTYWICYYMVLAQRMSKNMKNIKDIKDAMTGMDEIEKFLYDDAVSQTKSRNADG